MDINALLASARLAEEVVPVCLRPDLLADYKAAVTALEAAEAAHKTTGSVAARDKLAAKATVDDLCEQMLAASVRFTVRALPRQKFTKLKSEHPPREGNSDDARLGFDRDTFYDSLARACVVEPELSDGQWEQLDAVLSTAQWASLRATAWMVNSSDVDVPFLLAASRAPTIFAPNSAEPEASASASNGSTGGSHAPSTNTTSRASSSRPAKKSNGTRNSKG